MKYIALQKGFTALVDDEDYQRALSHHWWAEGTLPHLYAVTVGYKDGSYLRLADFVKGTPPNGCVWDHINGDCLDNTKANLRPANKSQNGANRGRQANNTSGYKGVFPVNAGQFRAQIKIGNKRLSLGRFPTAEEAARAYDQAARENFGSYAKLNFP